MNLFYTNPRSLQVARQAISRLLLVMLGSSTSAKTSDGSITSHVNKSAASHARRSSVKAGAANSTPKTRAITQAACTAAHSAAAVQGVKVLAAAAPPLVQAQSRQSFGRGRAPHSAAAVKVWGHCCPNPSNSYPLLPSNAHIRQSFAICEALSK